MTEIFSADTRPCNLLSQEFGLQVSSVDSFRLKLSNPNQGFQLVRWLLSKIYTRRQLLTKKEEVVLYYVHDYFENLRTTKSDSQNIRKLTLIRLLSITVQFWKRSKPIYLEKQIDLLLPQISMTPRAFLSFTSDFAERFLKRVNGRLKRCQPPPVRYIGVGYRDKGTAKNNAVDGSPSWQVVASFRTLTFKDYTEKITKETFNRMLSYSFEV